MRILATVLGGALLLGGCAGTQYTWYKRYDPSMEDRQRQIDLAACKSGAEAIDDSALYSARDEDEFDFVDACMVRHGWAKVRSS